MERESVSTLRLHEDERLAVGTLADEFLASLDGDGDPTRMSAAASVAAQRLPERLRTFLAGVRTQSPAVTVLANLPIAADLAPTPVGWELSAERRAGLREEAVLALCGAGLAEPFGWTSQQAGRLVHDVCPTPEAGDSLTSASSTRELNFHTEDVFHPCRADYVALLCLRNPTQVGTTYVRADALELTDEVREVLFQERFRFFPDDSHQIDAGSGDDPAEAPSGAVLYGPREAPYLRFDLDFMEPLPDDGPAAAAVDAVQKTLGRHIERVALAPGELVFIDNHQVVHGREPFHCRFDGTDRWLKRVNLTRDARRISALTGQRSVLV
ncbi:TauD/TfdA family dioxygenase [Streptomyces sp. NPDC004111]|uniref:TauD/TfdA family dioxygenase n=1 Tax=Streptomyces sp. NPDC004111 TaxID=3364690 RepID=UPI003696A53E